MIRPTGVTVIAVLYFIGAAFFICIGLAFLLGGGVMAAAIAERTGLSAAVIGAAGIVVFVMMLCFSALHFFVGWGLMKLKEWARIVAIVLTAISLFFGVIGLFRFSFFGIVRLAISGLILWYLMQPHVVAAFRPGTALPPQAPPPVPVG